MTLCAEEFPPCLGAWNALCASRAAQLCKSARSRRDRPKHAAFEGPSGFSPSAAVLAAAIGQARFPFASCAMVTDRPVGIIEALAGTLVVARAEARPGGRMARGGKAAHVTAELGDDRLGGAAGDPRDGVEARDRLGLGGGARRDATITGRDALGEEFDVPQELGEQEAVMGRDAPSERLGERRAFAPQAPLGQLRHLLGRARRRAAP